MKIVNILKSLTIFSKKLHFGCLTAWILNSLLVHIVFFNFYNKKIHWFSIFEKCSQIKYSPRVGGSSSNVFEVVDPYKQVLAFCIIKHTINNFPMADKI